MLGKTILQTLSDQGVPTTHIAQFFRHKNFKASRTRARFLQNICNLCQTCWPTYSEKAFSLPNAPSSNPLPLELKALAQPQQSSSITEQHSVVLFNGAVIQAEQLSVKIKALN